MTSTSTTCSSCGGSRSKFLPRNLPFSWLNHFPHSVSSSRQVYQEGDEEQIRVDGPGNLLAKSLLRPGRSSLGSRREGNRIVLRQPQGQRALQHRRAVAAATEDAELARTLKQHADVLVTDDLATQPAQRSDVYSESRRHYGM